MRLEVKNKGMELIVSMPEMRLPDSEVIASAHSLVLAAPDLLAALELALPSLIRMRSQSELAAYTAAIAAIKKAKGEL